MANQTVYLFCEGGPDSLDMALLKKIPFDGKTVIPQPFGGKGGHSKFMEGFGAYAKSLGTTPESHFIGFRDRDFDFEIPPVPQLIPAGEKVFAGYRPTIENYLLDPETIFQFTLSGGGEGRFSHAFLNSNAVKDIFEQAARQILAFQAARNALGQIRNFKAEQKTNFIDHVKEAQRQAHQRIPFLKSGTLPENLGVDFCIAESHKVIERFHQETTDFSQARFDECFQTFSEKFSHPEFFSKAEYLLYFQGKDLQSALSKLLPDQFSFKSYYKFAVNDFRYDQFMDLVELRNLIMQL